MPNNYTKILLRSWIKLAEEPERKHLEDILNQMRTGKLNLIWIKLPDNKKIQKNESRIINLEYNAVKSKNSIIGLELLPKKNHSVFYAIKFPEDHVLNNRKVKINVGRQKMIRNGWKKNAKGQINLGFIVPYLGSEIYKHCIKNNIIKDKKKFIEVYISFQLLVDHS